MSHAETLVKRDASTDIQETSPSIRIASELADTLDKQITDIKPLGETIDTDAIDTILEKASGNLTIEFVHEGCHVEVTADDVTVSLNK